MPNKFDINSELVKKLADLLDETGLSEIEFESTGRRIRVARSIGGAVPAVTVASPASAAATPASPATSDAESSAEQRRGTPITSPMVGTIFLSPEPAAKPFIQVGDTIPAFSAPDDRGEVFDSARLRGHPVLIKFFRAHW